MRFKEDNAPHVPVLVNQMVSVIHHSGLSDSKQRVFLDCTFGCGGYTSAILAADPLCRVIALDADNACYEYVHRLMKIYPGRVHFFSDFFAHFDRVLKHFGVHEIDGIVFDLGFSGLQIKDPQRGFSIYREGPLDMRFDRKKKKNAYIVVNKFSQKQLQDIFWKYSGERFSKRIASSIIQRRRESPIKTTCDLAKIVEQCVPWSKKKHHPATRIFQALRMFVNDEAEQLKIALHKTPSFMRRGSRICCVSFHSYEDRIVKEFFLQKSRSHFCVSRYAPYKNLSPSFSFNPKEYILPSPEEISYNRQARSARLRFATKI